MKKWRSGAQIGGVSDRAAGGESGGISGDRKGKRGDQLVATDRPPPNKKQTEKCHGSGGKGNP